MCWSSHTLPVKRIAEEDIKVKKVLKCINNVLYSPIYHFKTWEKGVTYSLGQNIEVQRCPYHVEYNITKGFHSCADIVEYHLIWYSRIKKGEDCEKMFRYDEYDIIVDAIIPKGSTYYLNEYGQYVSDKLIIV